MNNIGLVLWDKGDLNGALECFFQALRIEVNDEFGIYGQKINEVQVCPYAFYSFSINSDGTASACFLDWSRKLIIGDTKVESIWNIWMQ